MSVVSGFGRRLLVTVGPWAAVPLQLLNLLGRDLRNACISCAGWAVARQAVDLRLWHAGALGQVPGLQEADGEAHRSSPSGRVTGVPALSEIPMKPRREAALNRAAQDAGQLALERLTQGDLFAAEETDLERHEQQPRADSLVVAVHVPPVVRDEHELERRAELEVVAV
jgi:hypothetical protein